ncbi:IS4 family transposase, partial [Microcoleus sp. F8-D3]
DLGIVKSQRKPNVKLIVAPFPDRQRGADRYFFETSSQTPLTTAIQA